MAQPTRFEDFLEAPRAAKRIAADVGLDPAHAAALDSWADRVQNTNNAKFVEAKTSRLSRPGSRASRGALKKPDARRSPGCLSPMVAEAAATFGYELP
ncbi:MAG: hypothetical protein R2748_13735 [Bryobacterales bacterium]